MNIKAKKRGQYPCIRAWDRFMGSFASHTTTKVEQARQDNAPADAIYQRYEGSQPTGTWARLREVDSAETQRWFKNHYPNLVARFTRWEAK
jgi:hypothetical protein